ncbi:hypothetical protein BST81_21695 [Leptolyngbya sp. 'hensonii']|uniref:hypothetical protein n=1 Tax=Leptolyngbya sp. 'hensonii' TaxID=1922337 RepID=UPI000964F549|nr:hypothetical protein [Leptolyngbya sp. 'hensonii']OLP16221.1 hypothetical protein BST81_21695 [Leptolyngbya sp. 'hensonii']
MGVERWTDDQLDRLMANDLAMDQQLRQLTMIVAANATAISELKSSVSELRVSVSELRVSISEMREAGSELQVSVGDLRVSVNDLREGQAMLLQMFVQEQEAILDFRCTTNASLDRIDRALDYLMQQSQKEE